MTFPAIFLLAGLMWLLMSLIKYWYYSKFEIKYTHKLDDKVLEDIHRPPPHIRERIIKMQKEREKNFDVNPGQFYNTQRMRDIRNGKDPDETKDDKDSKPNENSNANFTNAKGRPLNIFEEMDLLKEQKGKKSHPPKYDRSMFEDPLSRLYKELRDERKKAEEMKKKESVSKPEINQKVKSSKKVSFAIPNEN